MSFTVIDGKIAWECQLCHHTRSGGPCVGIPVFCPACCINDVPAVYVIEELGLLP